MPDDNDPLTDTEPVVQTRYVSGESASETIVRALAVVEGVEPTDLYLLSDFIDPEALDTLLGDPMISDDPPMTVEFSVSNYRVVVSGDGLITILDKFDGPYGTDSPSRN